MRSITIAVSSLTLSSLALGAGAAAVAPASIATVVAASEVTEGKVVSIDEENSSFAIKTANDEQVMVKFDNKTAWYLDGELSTRANVLQKERQVKVTHAEGVATRVDAKS